MSWHRKVEGVEEDEDGFDEDARMTTERGFEATTVVVDEMFEDVVGAVTVTAPKMLEFRNAIDDSADIPNTTSVSDIDGITLLESI